MGALVVSSRVLAIWLAIAICVAFSPTAQVTTQNVTNMQRTGNGGVYLDWTTWKYRVTSGGAMHYYAAGRVGSQG